MRYSSNFLIYWATKILFHIPQSYNTLREVILSHIYSTMIMRQFLFMAFWVTICIDVNKSVSVDCGTPDLVQNIY